MISTSFQLPSNVWLFPYNGSYWLQYCLEVQCVCKNKNISKMSNFILNYCIKAKPKSILFKEVLVVCYSKNETTFPLKHMQILLTILRKVTHSYKNIPTCRSFKAPLCPFWFIYSKYIAYIQILHRRKIVCFVIGVTYEMPINAVRILQSL